MTAADALCPKCRNVKLVSSATDNGPDGTLFCPECNGLWLAGHGEEAAENLLPANEPDAAPPDPEADQKAGLCPHGHGLLTRARMDARPPFHLDRCSKCGGVWFDQGEMRLVIEAGLAEQLPNIWSFQWQRERRRERSRQEYLEHMKGQLGEDLYEKIIELSGRLADHPLRSIAIAFLTEEARGKAK